MPSSPALRPVPRRHASHDHVAGQRLVIGGREDLRVVLGGVRCSAARLLRRSGVQFGSADRRAMPANQSRPSAANGARPERSTTASTRSSGMAPRRPARAGRRRSAPRTANRSRPSASATVATSAATEATSRPGVGSIRRSPGDRRTPTGSPAPRPSAAAAPAARRAFGVPWCQKTVSDGLDDRGVVRAQRPAVGRGDLDQRVLLEALDLLAVDLAGAREELVRELDLLVGEGVEVGGPARADPAVDRPDLLPGTFSDDGGDDDPAGRPGRAAG